MKSEELSSLVVKGMEDMKAEDIVLMDLRKVKGAVSDFFVLCSGNSDTQIQAIAESIEKEVHKASKENPWRKEGFTNREWILIDYVNVVAHVFKKDKRAFFALEELWGDAVISEINTTQR
ncbi:ribosome-associated protein [Roseivirga pacifica]|uniref:Ribosomal silencing factor RsfS n=1 Tax=Roseivirga pacifica TaxID=1267423 RepID=A0A1I0RH35_9BACT|nr:ribosome silencing factor [Roseivirga pacifica]MCO6357682.1 ribosome silencing factor [Roseivirga pacifica]MCO6365935.1 ribosome silencing factor [Roseivirga pacifica]MCO6371263.1 ribosome silencing factor [Roseivirga pacifica]MCO6375566.1 ribosome silencing factor [Roseivirga pacifica]MCO6378641.1 ribosome silencing factor [Roseivirga pacifica]|tara:strand:+ start:1047 stop:1406 length:360 start_codon:yes stop_codon:yes gene_type:complete